MTFYHLAPAPVRNPLQDERGVVSPLWERWFLDAQQLINDILVNGRSNATGSLTLTAGATSTVVTDARISASSIITLMPTTATGAQGLLGTVERSENIPVETFRQGGTPPTATTIGTSPAVPGLLFDATGESAGLGLFIPVDFAGVADLELYLWCLLNGAETAADTIEWTCNYVTVRDSRAEQANGAGGAVTKTSTAITASTAVVTGGTAAGTLYEVKFTFDRSDANNPYDGQQGYIIYCEVNRTTVGGAGKVDGVVVSGAHIEYRAWVGGAANCGVGCNDVPAYVSSRADGTFTVSHVNDTDNTRTIAYSIQGSDP